MNKKQAAKYLDVSERTIERYCTIGKLTPEHVEGKFGVEAVFDKKELDRLKKQKNKPAPRPEPPANVSLARQQRQQELLTVAGAIGQALAAQLAEAQRLLPPAPQAAVSNPVPVSELLILTLRQAAQLSGLSAGKLREDIRRKKLKASRDLGRGFKIKRADLDAYVAKL